MRFGDLAAGHDWYKKAEERGAERGAIDQDLRLLLVRSISEAQDRICAFLLAQDPERCGWLRSWGKHGRVDGRSSPAL